MLTYEVWGLSPLTTQILLPFRFGTPGNLPWPWLLLSAADMGEEGTKTTLWGGTYSVLPLFFKPVFKFSDLLFKALNPSSELGRCQILVFVIVGPQGGAPSPVRDTLESASPEGSHWGSGSDEDGRGGCNWSPCSWIKEIWPLIGFVISAIVPAIKWVWSSLVHMYNLQS